jgi:hypothetical protein
MERHSPNPDAHNLEEAFFADENRRLLQRMREKSDKEAERAALREALPNADDALLDHFIELGIRPETALAVVLVPLALVAWADGTIDPPEREAILRGAAERGMKPGTPARELLESWLGRKPGAEVVAAWKRYVRTVGTSLGPADRHAMREGILGMARGVAQAAGGFLGLTSKISAAERAVLDDLERALPE